MRACSVVIAVVWISDNTLSLQQVSARSKVALQKDTEKMPDIWPEKVSGLDNCDGGTAALFAKAPQSEKIPRVFWTCS
jgi:hypothetical protein